MDTSERYIRMCGQADDMQEVWKPQDFDVVMGEYVSTIKEWKVVQGIGEASIKPFFTTAGKWAWYRRDELIWLPRQDELQALADFDVWYDAITTLYHWNAKTEHGANDDEVGSMEQVWLRFYMDTVHSKWWDETRSKWVEK